MARANNRVTKSQIEEIGKMLDVTFTPRSKREQPKHCWSPKCTNKAEVNVQGLSVLFSSCKNSNCQLTAAAAASSQSLEASLEKQRKWLREIASAARQASRTDRTDPVIAHALRQGAMISRHQ